MYLNSLAHPSSPHTSLSTPIELRDLQQGLRYKNETKESYEHKKRILYEKFQSGDELDGVSEKMRHLVFTSGGYSESAGKDDDEDAADQKSQEVQGDAGGDVCAKTRAPVAARGAIPVQHLDAAHVSQRNVAHRRPMPNDAVDDGGGEHKGNTGDGRRGRGARDLNVDQVGYDEQLRRVMARSVDGHAESQRRRDKRENVGSVQVYGVGQPVECRFQGLATFCKGTVVCLNDDGTLNIQYNDGDHEFDVMPELVRALSEQPRQADEQGLTDVPGVGGGGAQDGIWPCAYCTFHNPAKDLICGACFQTRQPARGASFASGGLGAGGAGGASGSDKIPPGGVGGVGGVGGGEVKQASAPPIPVGEDISGNDGGAWDIRGSAACAKGGNAMNTGDRCKVFYEKYERWFPGTIEEVITNKQQYGVQFDDGERTAHEWERCRPCIGMLPQVGYIP